MSGHTATVTRIPGQAPLDDQTLHAVGELLQAAAQAGLGVAFEPDGDGWRVSYIINDWPAYQEYELKGGQLANAYDLHIAAAASLKPLIELGERADAYFASRESR